MISIINSNLSGNFTCLQTVSYGNGFILAVAISLLPGTSGYFSRLHIQ